MGIRFSFNPLGIDKKDNLLLPEPTYIFNSSAVNTNPFLRIVWDSQRKRYYLTETTKQGYQSSHFPWAITGDLEAASVVPTLTQITQATHFNNTLAANQSNTPKRLSFYEEWGYWVAFDISTATNPARVTVSCTRIPNNDASWFEFGSGANFTLPSGSAVNAAAYANPIISLVSTSLGGQDYAASLEVRFSSDRPFVFARTGTVAITANTSTSLPRYPQSAGFQAGTNAWYFAGALGSLVYVNRNSTNNGYANGGIQSLPSGFTKSFVNINPNFVLAGKDTGNELYRFVSYNSINLLNSNLPFATKSFRAIELANGICLISGRNAERAQAPVPLVAYNLNNNEFVALNFKNQPSNWSAGNYFEPFAKTANYVWLHSFSNCYRLEKSEIIKRLPKHWNVTSI